MNSKLNNDILLLGEGVTKKYVALGHKKSKYAPVHCGNSSMRTNMMPKILKSNCFYKGNFEAVMYQVRLFYLHIHKTKYKQIVFEPSRTSERILVLLLYFN